MRFPVIAGRPDDDFLVVADVFHLNRTDDQMLRFLDDHIFQRNVLLLDLLPELQVGAGRLPKLHHPLLPGHGTDHTLRDMRQELQAPRRGHVGRFLHDPYLRQLATLVIGEHHLLLVPMPIVTRVQRAVQIDRVFIVGAQIIVRSYHQTGPFR